MYTNKCIQHTYFTAEIFAFFRGEFVTQYAYASSQLRSMHSQRADSSTVSTGLSTISQGKSGGKSRFLSKLSPLSTGYPQVLSTHPDHVDIHVDISFCRIFVVYTCDIFAYLFITMYVRHPFHEKSGLIHPRISQFRKLSFLTKTPYPQRNIRHSSASTQKGASQWRLLLHNFSPDKGHQAAQPSLS